ncbi:RimK family alpha-L-glutamate ligase [Salibacteraceae bacterium]|nr:RimK family alpha-L-glutamate ligase [Salibacteraceae bacterium]
MAILVNKEEKSPPSNERALVKFKESVEKQGFFVEFITKDDASRINEFDALFIRATTSVNHFTYKIARKAESEGLVVIDDSSSILKCANKVYLAELLRNAKIETPKTLIIHSDNKNEVVETLGLPCILKLPDSSFSVGVVKVSTLEELNDTLKKMLEQSELLIGQSYMPTDFDWRIGVIDGKAFYACKYFMARGHWQIYNWSSGNKEDIIGDFETLEISNVPVNIISMAEKATALIGSGLYGVDLKESNGKVVVIEINDNPSIDFGVEDLIDKDLVYDKIIGRIKRKVMSRATNEKYDYV